MSHSYSIRPTVDGEVYRWIIWSDDEVTPLLQGVAASKDAAVSAVRTGAPSLAAAKPGRGQAVPSH
jgi:hypothetical protein